MQLFHLVDFS